MTARRVGAERAHLGERGGPTCRAGGSSRASQPHVEHERPGHHRERDRQGCHPAASGVGQQQPADRWADDEGRHLDGDEQVGRASASSARDTGHRRCQGGVGRRAARDGEGRRDNSDHELVLPDSERYHREQQAAAQQGHPEQPVATEPVGQRAGRPRQRDVGKHPCGAGEPQPQAGVGRAFDPVPHEHEQQRPRQRHRHRCERVARQQPPDGGSHQTRRVGSGANPLNPTVE